MPSKQQSKKTIKINNDKKTKTDLFDETSQSGGIIDKSDEEDNIIIFFL